MQFYLVTESGALRKINKVDFNENKVYLIDDFKTLYLWFGVKATKKKKDLSRKRAEILKNQREKSTEIKSMYQNQEYGSLLAIIDILKKGLKPNDHFDKRPELEIEFEETMELIEAGIDPDFEAEITVAAHNLSQEKNSYEDLCRMLAELQLNFLKGKGKPSDNEIVKKTEEIYKSSSTYDELCWLIAELSKLFEEI
ncbi:MAG: hypothetical protein JSV23_07245 [Promethearchaeota archaeon]|nr:MAG: hypothetical protein JSV23_07245 [Candidatus Lokiarchaeota archaeon]